MKDDYRIRIEQCVSLYLGREWRVLQVQDMADLSSHPAAILSDGDCSVFAKLYEGSLTRDQVTLELAGLQLLTACSEVLTPDVISNIETAGGAGR